MSTPISLSPSPSHLQDSKLYILYLNAILPWTGSTSNSKTSFYTYPTNHLITTTSCPFSIKKLFFFWGGGREMLFKLLLFDCLLQLIAFPNQSISTNIWLMANHIFKWWGHCMYFRTICKVALWLDFLPSSLVQLSHVCWQFLFLTRFLASSFI